MDIEVRWSPEATEDTESIAEYIARDSEFYAQSVVTEILAVSRHIHEFSLIGRIVREIGDELIRELFIYNYRVVYRVEPTRILIVAVTHGKHLLESISERF